MAKITRKAAKIFGGSAPAAEIGVFGSLAAGSVNTSVDPDTIQGLAAWAGGWYDAIIGNSNPAIEDMNGVLYTLAYQIAYTLQTGVPEYQANTIYYTGSVVNDGSGNLYVSRTNDNSANALSSTTNWVPLVGVNSTTGGVTLGLTAGLYAVAGAYHNVYGPMKLGTTSAATLGTITANSTVEITPNAYRNAAGTQRAIATQTGYTGIALARQSSASSTVFTLYANYQDAQTADTTLTSTNERTLFSVTATGASTIGFNGSTGLGTGAAPYHTINGSLKGAYAGGGGAWDIGNSGSLELNANLYRDGSANTKALATATGYSQLTVARSTTSGDPVLTLIANYQDAQTADALAVATNTRTLMQITASGAAQFGASSTSTYHNFVNSTTSTATFRAANLNTTTSSDGVPTVYLIKGSTTNTTGTNRFIEFYINQGSTGSGYLASNGANSAALFNTSDRRLKKDIAPLDGALNKILALNPVSYKWKSDASPATGFIAQELIEILPQFVVQTDDGVTNPEPERPWSVTEDGFVTYLVKAIQEQQTLIQNQQNLINSLIARIEALEGAKK